ncbi:MarR family winged helix-turn-helix transcriptional regulator [Amycolatopsis sp. NPDC098790]|uniref:MarR family winged helix-turn-helix transcriptional regulator n=1 Tax=Amycolatopsis sp. NPDC098790 TaxID=3363939 RepID=UPI00380D0A43
MDETKDGTRVPARLQALVSWQVNKVSTLGARLFARGLPLTARADYSVLAALDDGGPLSQADIGRHLSLDRNDVNGIVNRLDRTGRIRRETDPADRRRNIVVLTDAGLAYLTEIQQHTDAVQDELLSALTATERRQLQALLTKVLDGHAPQPA